MDKNTNNANTTWISIADAAMLLKVKPSTIIRRIQSGKLIFRTPSDVPFTNDGSPNYEVCLNSLPQKLQY